MVRHKVRHGPSLRGAGCTWEEGGTDGPEGRARQVLPDTVPVR